MEREVSISSWDANPDVAGLPDGRIVCLRSGEVRGWREEDGLISMTLGAVPDESGHCPKFLEALEGWIRDVAIRDYVAAFFGLAMSGRRTQHVVYFFGTGGNGKSQLVHVGQRAAGGYFKGVGAETLQRGGRHRQELARLSGARACDLRRNRRHEMAGGPH